MTEFENWLKPHLKVATPGLKIAVTHRGKLIFNQAYGEVYRFYDLASLTKIIMTVTAVMSAVSEGKLNLQEKVSHYLPFFQSGTRVHELLTHSSGLIWWVPFYEKIKGLETATAKVLSLEKEIAELSRDLPVGGVKSVYSDVGFLTLGLILREVFAGSGESIFQELKKQGLVPMGIHYNPVEFPPLHDQSQYAPTEVGGERAPLLQGQVNDENAWYLGGTAPHAGLFGSLEDVTEFALKMRSLHQNGHPKLPKEIIQKFLTRAVPKETGDWALGWMMPTAGSSSCGQYFSENSVGHTGFTGTSLWWDLQKDIQVIILSNRTLLGKEKKDFAKLRPQIHDQVLRQLGLMGE